MCQPGENPRGGNQMFWLFRRGQSLVDEIERFFGINPRELPIVSRSFSSVDLPNLQVAIDEYCQETFANARAVGYTGVQQGLQDGLKDLIGGTPWSGGANVGPVQYRAVDIDVDRQMDC